jgi:hypothetical protein
MKTPKFLICNDFMSDQEGLNEFILHNHRPRFLAKVNEIAFEEIVKTPEKLFADVLYVNSEGVMEIFRLEIIENYDRSNEESLHDELFSATEYYTNYLQDMEKEDGQTPGYPVKDYSTELPGLKILQAPGNWTVVYNGLVAEFTTEEEMDEFLEHDLEIEPELLDQGVINRFD